MRRSVIAIGSITSKHLPRVRPVTNLTHNTLLSCLLFRQCHQHLPVVGSSGELVFGELGLVGFFDFADP
ncbi:MAG TPA: hypothetical protein PLY13_07935, partial [Methanoregulaceae archaeon]|nr:hypothetical protein [Methanoregulaceae archaeon]